MQIDFSRVDDVESYVSIPEGTYLCRIAEVREGVTREGSARWAFRLEVADGELAGRTAAWDGLVWSERALPRVKQVLARLGFDVSGTLELQPTELIGRTVRAQLVSEQREDPLTGRVLVRLRVPYMGYEPADETRAPF
jgi:hypothetical protein